MKYRHYNQGGACGYRQNHWKDFSSITINRLVAESKDDKVGLVVNSYKMK